MRVLFLQQQPCIRTLKYAVGLRSTGRRLHLGFARQGQSLTEWYGEGDELFDRWWQLGPDPAADLAGVVSEFRPDVIHSHNLPDRLTVLALEVADGSVPVVHDVHDLQSLRRTPYEDGFPEPADPLVLEKRAVEGCTAMVTVSQEMSDQVAARHRAPQRQREFANFALQRDLPAVLPPPERARRGPPRVVYQGTLSTNGGHYDLRRLFVALAGQGVRLDIYPARPAPEYRALADATPGLRCHEMLPPRRLLEVLPRYDFGWAGFNDSLNRAHLDTALPNKVFEYVGCGLPVLTLGHRALVRLLDEEGIGLSLPHLDGLAQRLGELDLVALRRQVAKARSHLTVEANIGHIGQLYAEVVSSTP